MKNPQSLALLCDFYQLTMAYAYWKSGIDKKESSFHMFFRRPPFRGGFTMACGLESIIEYITNFAFSTSDLDYLASCKTASGAPFFDEAFLRELEILRLFVNVDAVPEGTAMFPYEPLVRVDGPLLQCQLLESPILNLINFPTLIATKAARIALAAQGDPVMEFGLRRAQGIDGALTASRACYIGGCSSTSNVLAGKIYGIPVQGTHAHSWVMAFETEQEAFSQYAKVLPEHCLFLVDTYNTLEGVQHAIKVGKELKAQGKKLLGIRLDSGDLAQLSIKSRKLLDEAGFSDAVIVASNELDEIVISELKHQGAKISVWGVGTNLVTGSPQPALDGVYKLSALKDEHGTWQYTLKLSEQLAKISNPGRLQVKRFSQGEYFADILYDVDLGISAPYQNIDPFDPTKSIHIGSEGEAEDLLVPIFREGRLCYKSPSLKEIREYAAGVIKRLPVGVKRFLNPHLYPVGMQKELYDRKVALIKKIRGRIGS
jgi:nicotinate phosphoribosyltransferase